MTTLEKERYSKAVRNGILSFVLGDVMGTPVQFYQRRNLQEALKGEPISRFILKGKPRIPFGSWSDDSSMTLCTMKSIVEKSGIDLKNLVEYFIKWLFGNYMTPFDKTFDVGRTEITAFGRYKQKDGTVMDFDIPKGSTDMHSNGNGSLIRILPVSIYCYFKKLSQKETFKTICDVSSLSHAHGISVLGCYIYTLMVFGILDGKSKDEIISDLKNIYSSDAIPESYKEYLDEYKDIINGDIVNKNTEDIDSSGYIKSTLDTAIWGFYHSDTVEDCILKILEFAQDTDSNAAVGAGLSGLYYGLRGHFADEYWTEKIIRRDMILALTDEFIEAVVG